jgi:selenocysteine-specific elongation factor
VELHPTGKRLRVRGIQVHNRPADAALAGQRTAINVAGVGANIESSELVRGMQLAEAGRFLSTKRVDCLLHVLSSATAIKNGTQVHFHAGTAEVVAKAVLLESPSDTNKRVEPGKSGYVQFRLRDPILLLPGDHFIIRQISPLITIGGGRVLDNWVGRPMTRAQGLLRLPSAEEKKLLLDTLNSGTPAKVLESILDTSAGGCLNEAEIIARTGWLLPEIREASGVLSTQGRIHVLSNSPLLIVQSERFVKLSDAVVKALEQFHRQNPLLPGISKEALRAQIFVRAHPILADTVLKSLGDAKKIVFAGEAVRLASHKIVLRDDEEQAKNQIASAFQGAGLTVPSVKEVLGKLPLEPRRAEKILTMLLQEKTLVKVSDELVFHADAIAKLRQVLAAYKVKSNKINVAIFKELTQVSRKYAIPLLEYLDKERVTRRAGDERILL